MFSIRILNDLDKERYARDEARNKLESFVYSASDYLEKEAVQTVSTSEERANLLQAVEEASEWLMINAEEAPKREIDTQLIQLEKLKKPIARRLTEFQERPGAIESLRTALSDIDSFTTLMTQNLTLENKEKLASTIDQVHTGAKKTLEWLEEKVKLQDATASSVEPVLLVKVLKTKQRELEELKFKLMREIIALPPPPPPKPEPTAEDPSSTTSADQEEKEKPSSQPTEDDSDSSTTTTPPSSDDKDEL